MTIVHRLYQFTVKNCLVKQIFKLHKIIGNKIAAFAVVALTIEMIEVAV